MMTDAPTSAQVAITVTRSPARMVAGGAYVLTWSSANASSISRVCTSSGGGYTVSDAPALNGSESGTASSNWVNHSSACTWIASGSSGSATATETMVTDALTLPPVTISVSRNPAPMIAGKPYSVIWSSTNATSVSRVCTPIGSSGYTASDAPGTSGREDGTAIAAWVDHPSTCTWTATGAAGTATATDAMMTQPVMSGDGVTYIHTDGLGSPVARTDSAGQVVSRTRYDDFYKNCGTAPEMGADVLAPPKGGKKINSSA